MRAPKSLLLNQKLRDSLWIIACGSAVAALLSPFQNAPFIDDWIYASRVVSLLDHGELDVLNYAANPNLVQVLWGALFCLPFGFSFTALRVSTWVLALAGLIGQYLLLRELEASRRDALLGTAALGLYPIFFMLSFTFMTDVPFVTFMVFSAFAFIRAVRREHSGWLLVSTLFGCLATGVRVQGAAIFVAAALALLFHTHGWGIRKGRILVPLIPILLFIMGFLWFRPRGFLHRAFWLPYLLDETLVAIVLVVGLAVLPLSLASMRRSLARRCALWIAPLGVVMVTSWTYSTHAPLRPLDVRSFWSFSELGLAKRWMSGFKPLDPSPLWVWVLAAAGLISFSLLLASALPRPCARGELFLWLGAGHSLLIGALWLQHDRYILVLVPVAIALLIGRGIRHPRLAVGLLLVMAVLSFVGLRNHLHFNRALWQAVEDLRRQGIPDAEINGGFTVNSWLQRAHPENARIDAEGRRNIPWVNTKKTSRYQISSTRQRRGRLLSKVPYSRWGAPAGSLYILDHGAEATP